MPAGLTVDLEFNVRDVGTGVALFSASGHGATLSQKRGKASDATAEPASDPATDAMRKALYDAAVDISTKFRELDIPWKGTVLSASGEEVILSLGTEDKVRAGDTFAIKSQGRELIDPNTRLPYRAAEAVVGAVRVDQVDGNTSVARVVDRQAPFKIGDSAVYLGSAHESGEPDGKEPEVDGELGLAARTVTVKPGTSAFAGPGRSFAAVATDASSGGQPLQLIFAFRDWIKVLLTDGKAAWVLRDATTLKLAGANAQ